MLLRCRSQKRRGTVVILVAVCLVAIMGIVAIALDGGLLLDQRRRVQAAADAAALAAAVDLYNNYQFGNGLDVGGTAKASALSNAAVNGYSNDGTTSTVTVNIPPSSGDHANQPGYAEVIIQFNQKRAFSTIFGSGDLPVKARAVARGKWTAFNNGIIVLDPTKEGSLTTTGNGNVGVTGGASLIVNSNHSSAAVATGNARLEAPTFEITGVPGTSTSGGGLFVGKINSGVPPTPDPLRYLPPPNPASLPLRSSRRISITGRNSMTLQQGVYEGGITVSGSGSLVMEPGIYYIKGGSGFTFTGGGNLLANEVLIYYTDSFGNGSGIDVTGNGSVVLTPPTTGIYRGISVFQDRNLDEPVNITGNGNAKIKGTFYAAKAPMNVTGNGGDKIGSQYISRTLTVTGNGDFNVDWNADETARTRIIGLVE